MKQTWKNGLPSSPDYFPLGVWLQSPENASRVQGGAAARNASGAAWNARALMARPKPKHALLHDPSGKRSEQGGVERLTVKHRGATYVFAAATGEKTVTVEIAPEDVHLYRVT